MFDSDALKKLADVVPVDLKDKIAEAFNSNLAGKAGMKNAGPSQFRSATPENPEPVSGDAEDPTAELTVDQLESEGS